MDQDMGEEVISLAKKAKKSGGKKSGKKC